MGHTGIGWRYPHYAELMESRPVLPFLEVHSENFFGEGGAALAVLTRARGHYPVSLHGVGLGLGSTCGVDPLHLQQLARLVGRMAPVRVSDHACFARGLLPGGQMVHGSDLLPLPFSREALDVLCANVQRVQDALKRPIAVENLSAYIHLGGPEYTEPEYLNALAARTGCQLLVDVNNIYVNALNAQLLQPQDAAADPMSACCAWLDAIDASAVAEIHLAGHCTTQDLVIDDHGSRVCPAVWELYTHAVNLMGPVPTLIEWDTDIPALEVLLSEAALADSILEMHAGVTA